MEKTKNRKLRYYLRLTLWVLLAQVILANISASIYAYKFTHFYSQPPPAYANQNVFDQTWKLFVGPKFYKNTLEPEPAFPYQQVTLKTTDSISIDGWYSTVDTAKGCVVLMHGLTVNKSYVEKEAVVFRSWGYNVLLIDFRAHGRSGGSNSSFGCKETDELTQAVTYARAHGNKKIILYGASLGAGVSIKAVSEQKVQADAIIADMPFGTLHNHLKARARVLGFPSEPFGALVTMWIGFEHGYNGFNHDISAYAKKVTCPVMVEWGEKDRYVSREEVDNVYASLASAYKKMVTYPDADHESFLHVDPNTWQREVKAFLDGIPE